MVEHENNSLNYFMPVTLTAPVDPSREQGQDRQTLNEIINTVSEN